MQKLLSILSAIATLSAQLQPVGDTLDQTIHPYASTVVTIAGIVGLLGTKAVVDVGAAIEKGRSKRAAAGAVLAAALSLALFASACSPESALAWTKKSTATLAQHLDRTPALAEVAAEFRPFNEAVQRLERLDAAAALGLLPLAERVAAAADRASGGRASELVRSLAGRITSRLKKVAGGASPTAGAKEAKDFERDLARLEALLSE